MHEEFMEAYGGYLKEHYTDLEHMTMKDLCDAKCIAKVMEQIFKADKEYNIVKAMEEHEDQSDIEMTWDEFYIRLKDMFKNADTGTKIIMRQQITDMLA